MLLKLRPLPPRVKSPYTHIGTYIPTVIAFVFGVKKIITNMYTIVFDNLTGVLYYKTARKADTPDSITRWSWVLEIN